MPYLCLLISISGLVPSKWTKGLGYYLAPLSTAFTIFRIESLNIWTPIKENQIILTSPFGPILLIISKYSAIENPEFLYWFERSWGSIISVAYSPDGWFDCNWSIPQSLLNINRVSENIKFFDELSLNLRYGLEGFPNPFVCGILSVTIFVAQNFNLFFNHFSDHIVIS